MNEKDNLYLVIALVITAVIFGGTVGFSIGGGNIIRPAGPGRANRKPAAAAGELRTELGREGAVAERLGSKQDEERVLIRDALDACRRTGEGIQGVVAKMEILNALIRELERRAGGGGGPAGGE